MIEILKVTEPTLLPIDLAEAKTHIRVDHALEDATLTVYAHAVAVLVEEYLNNPLMSRQLKLLIPHFMVEELTSYDKSGIFLPYSKKLISVDSFQYLDADNQLQNFTEYTTSSNTLCFIHYNNTTYPTISVRPDAVQITYTAGYTAHAQVPPAIKYVLYALIGSCYENREIPKSLSPHVCSYLSAYRVNHYKLSA